MIVESQNARVRANTAIRRPPKPGFGVSRVSREQRLSCRYWREHSLGARRSRRSLNSPRESGVRPRELLPFGLLDVDLCKHGPCEGKLWIQFNRGVELLDRSGKVAAEVEGRRQSEVDRQRLRIQTKSMRPCSSASSKRPIGARRQVAKLWWGRDTTAVQARWLFGNCARPPPRPEETALEPSPRMYAPRLDPDRVPGRGD